MTELMDTAVVTVINKLDKSIILYRQYADCEECPLLPSISVPPNGNGSIRLSTNWDSEFSVRDNSSLFEFYRFTETLWDQGQYNILVQPGSYAFQTIDSGRSNIWPVIAVIAFCLVAAGLYITGLNVYKRYKKSRSSRVVILSYDTNLDDKIDNSKLTKPENSKKKKRLKSLDAFRGIDMVMMIFVNFGCGGYYLIDHAPWNGLHFADVIFPWFVFMMGTSIAMSLRSQVLTHKKKILPVFWKIAFRTIKLIGIGLILDTRGREPKDLKYLRLPGVLQRFGVSYFVIATLHMLSLYMNGGNFLTKIYFLKDILPYWLEWLFMIAFGLTYGMLTFVWKYDKSGFCPPGYLGPGGLHMNRTRWNCTGGAAHFIDLKVFTSNHIYQLTTSSELYNPDGIYHVNISHDPEGLLGCCTSILLTFAGLQVGKILVAYQSPLQRMIRWASWGLVLGGIACLLHFTKWEPINKNLWSYSFVCVTGGMGFIAITVLYFIIDIKSWWKNGQPFHYAGMNSILLYVGSEMTFTLLPWTFYIDSSSHWPHLILNLWTATLWLSIAVILAKKKIFWTL